MAGVEERSTRRITVPQGPRTRTAAAAAGLASAENVAAGVAGPRGPRPSTAVSARPRSAIDAIVTVARWLC